MLLLPLNLNVNIVSADVTFVRDCSVFSSKYSVATFFLVYIMYEYEMFTINLKLQLKPLGILNGASFQKSLSKFISLSSATSFCALPTLLFQLSRGVCLFVQLQTLAYKWKFFRKDDASCGRTNDKTNEVYTPDC